MTGFNNFKISNLIAQFSAAAVQRCPKDFLRVKLVKNNLNQLKKLIREFEGDDANGGREKSLLLEQIVLFGPKFQISRTAIFNAVGSVRAGILPAFQDEYAPGTQFFRMRPLSSALENPVEGDFWEPPEKYASRGRLNKPNQPLLYISTEFATTAAETGVDVNLDRYLLILYTARTKILVTFTELNVQAVGSVLSREKLKFINKVLSKKGPSAHILSQIVAEKYVNFSLHGWSYDSMKYVGGRNICLRNKTRELLSMDCAVEFYGEKIVAIHRVGTNGAISSQKSEKELREEFDFLSAQYSGKAKLPIMAAGTRVLCKVLAPE